MSCSLFFLQVVLKLFDYFWKPNGRFTSFVLYVCWCTTSYTVKIVLWKMLMEPVNAPARWWPCACLKGFSDLRRLEKTLNFLRCLHVFDRVLKCGWHKWSKLVTGFLLLLCIGGYGCLRCWNELFSAVFHVLDWSFLVLHFDGNGCKWIPKVIWPRMDWYCDFLLENGFLRWLHICMDWKQELLNCYSFLTTSFFLDV